METLTQTFFTNDEEFVVTHHMLEPGKLINLRIISDEIRILMVNNTNIIALDTVLCPKLTEIQCNYNRLTQIKHNTRLEVLECRHNLLRTLWITNNLKRVDCSYNNINRIKTNSSLKKLFCTHNYLSKIILNRHLLELSCSFNKIRTMNANYYLQTLKCDHNRIRSLYLNRRLQKLYCHCNKLTTLSLNAKLGYLSSRNNMMTHLKLNSIIKIRDFNSDTIDSEVIIIPYILPRFKSMPDPNDKICPICLESNDLILTNCNHAFHPSCLWMTKISKCPMCRAHVPQLDLI